MTVLNGFQPSPKNLDFTRFLKHAKESQEIVLPELVSFLQKGGTKTKKKAFFRYATQKIKKI